MKYASNRRGAVCFLVLNLTGLMTFAQDLENYLQEIRTQNPAYQAASHRWQAARENIAVAGSLPDPNVSLGVFVEEVETRVGPQKQRLSLSQMIPWKGKLSLMSEQAEEMAEKARSERDTLGLKLETEFSALYAEYYYIGRSIAITSDHLRLLKDLEAVVTERYENSAAQYHDLIRIQIEIDALTDRLRAQRESGPPVAASMNVILGQPVAATIPYPVRLPVYRIPDRLDPAEWTAKLKHNPVLRGMGHQISADRVSLDLAKKNYFPDFRIGLDWTNTGSAINPALADSGKDPLMISLGVNIPIWRRKYRALDRAAAARVEVSLKQQDDTRANLQANLKRALFQVDDAGRKIHLYRDQIIPKAEESLTVITSAFQTGDNSYLDLIAAEKSLLEFHLSLNQAEANQLKAISAIQWVLGERPFPLAEE